MFFNWGKKKNKPQELCTKGIILIVDDDDVDRKLITSILTKQKYSIISGKDGEEGLELAKRHIPDLILSDCQMPNMDGVEMFKKLQEDNRTANIPFVFLTSNESPANLIDCFDLGAENYLCKPINSKVITSQIEEILQENLKR